MSATPQAQAGHISPRAAQAVEALLTGQARTQKAAAKLAGISEEHFCKLLKRPHYIRFIQERSAQYLKGIPAVHAAATLARLASARSDDVAAKVSTRIAEHAGILIPHAAPTGAVAGNVPLLTIVMRHQAIDGSSVQAAVQIGAQGEGNAAVPAVPALEVAPTKEAGDPGVPE